MSDKKATINFEITLDNNNNPIKILWEATDSPFDNQQNCKALFLTLWDHEKKQSFGIDLWTNEMMVHEMNMLCYQSLLKIADSYEKATKNTQLTNVLRECATTFAKILKEEEEKNKNEKS